MYEPLDTQNPEIELDLTFLRSRLGYEEKKVRIQTQSGDLILLKGIMFNGKLKGKVDKKLSNHPAWRSMFGSCHFDRASNDKFSVEFLIFGIVIFFNHDRVLKFGAPSRYYKCALIKKI